MKLNRKMSWWSVRRQTCHLVGASFLIDLIVPCARAMAETDLLLLKKLSILQLPHVLRIPKDVVLNRRQMLTCLSPGLLENDLRYAVGVRKHFIQDGPHTMHILVADLHKDRARISQQIARHRQPVTQISQVTVDPIAPRIPECLHLFRFASDVAEAAVLHVAARRAPLEIAIELDAIRRVQIDALDLAP